MIPSAKVLVINTSYVYWLYITCSWNLEVASLLKHSANVTRDYIL